MHERKSKPDYLENWQFETPKASTLKVATTDRELIALYESGESLIDFKAVISTNLSAAAELLVWKLMG